MKKFIEENRNVIDEFLGPNHSQYIAIALKGQIAKEFKDKDRTFSYFEALMESGKSQEEQNAYMRILLSELRNNNKNTEDPLMRFGINSNLLIGKDKLEFISIMEGEFPYSPCPSFLRKGKIAFCPNGNKCRGNKSG